MESTLLNGQYAAKDAAQLIAKLYKVKTDFHIAKIDTRQSSEEDIKQSENRLKELEGEVRDIVRLLNGGNCKQVAIHAKLTIELFAENDNA